MTEAEWLACTDSYPMLNPLEGKVSDRKCYLFSFACLRRINHLLTDERCRKLVDVYERFVDNLASNDERASAEEGFGVPYEAGELEDGAGGNTLEALRNLACYRGAAAAFSVAHAAADAVGYVAAQSVPAHHQGAESSRTTMTAGSSATAAERQAQAALVRDILGPLPFRPIRPDPAWLTTTVLTLARTSYDQRGFDHLPVLADALEEAGCHDPDILNHCRQPGEHVRGCWLVDLLLGKE
jgi:hypothetical protein